MNICQFCARAFSFVSFINVLNFHTRRVVEERNSCIAEQSAMKARQEADRLDFKKQTAKSVCQKERERQEKAENWKHARINAMKERQLKHDEMENSYEEAAQEYKASREVRESYTPPLW